MGPSYGVPRRELALAFFVAVAVRIVMLLLVAYRHDIGDGYWYDVLAHNLNAHGTFSLSLAPPIEPTFYRPPLYPALMAAVYRVWDAVLAVQLVQVLVSAATAILFALTVERLTMRIARLALWLAVLVPANSVYVGVFLAETFTTFFIVAAMAAPVLWSSRASWWLMGVCLAAAALTRDVYMALIPFIAMLLPFAMVHDLVAETSKKRRFLSAAFVVLGAVMTIGPWTMRNFAHSKQVIPISKGILGQGLWIGTWEMNGEWLVRGGFEHGPPAGSYRNEAEKKEVEAALALKDAPRDKAMKKLAFDRYREEPFSVLGRWLWRVPQMWLGTRFDTFAFRPAFLAYGTAPWFVVKLLLYAVHSGLVVLAVLGLALAIYHRSWLVWLGIPIVYNALIFVPLHSTEPRYSQPVYLFVCAFAAYFALMMYDRWRRDKT